MLSALSAGPDVNIPNAEKIQIARSPSNTPGALVGKESVDGSGEVISKMAQSANGGGTGRGTGVTGVAVGGDAGYQVAGLSSKAGTRKIRGSIVGGATYTQLKKNEGLTRDQVMEVVQKHQSEIQQCYERSLLLNPDLVGRGDFEWKLKPKELSPRSKSKRQRLGRRKPLVVRKKRFQKDEVSRCQKRRDHDPDHWPALRSPLIHRLSG